MLIPVYTKRFKKDLDLLLKRGKDKEKIKTVAKRLIEETGLEDKHRVHKLSGGYTGQMECHIEPDWLLIYRVKDGEIIFDRTGSHSDLFV
ncbi:MAG: type II toxin-antitoxin system YafQ family toxin [Nitrospirae bacterium]|nr:type II toxin-antitoxin system YafQ family toxin [Nitrospirota bacterium]